MTIEIIKPFGGGVRVWKCNDKNIEAVREAAKNCNGLTNVIVPDGVQVVVFDE